MCRAHGNQTQPATGSGYIVWTDRRNAGHHLPDYPPDTDVRGYHISGRHSFRITLTTGRQTSPDLDGIEVVYAEYRDTHMGAPSAGIVKGAVLRR